MKPASDSVTGDWAYNYDVLNRLQSASASSGPYASHSGCWAYDAFGKRTAEEYQTSACPSPESRVPATASYNGVNRVAWTSVNSAANGFAYDASGNVVGDNLNQYVYDVEGRLCAVHNTSLGTMTQYVYDAEGHRVAKGTLSTWPATGSACNAPTSANGFSPTSGYALDLSGNQFAEVNGTGNWMRTNIFADGKLLATYAGSDTYFALTDWLGTKRAEITPDGYTSTSFSLPFGNQLTTSGNAPDATEHHFTGKERDTESGLDYFGARYLGSSMGRFQSPDPSGLYFADPTNPQSLNLYAYALNNPLRFTDPTGLYCFYGDPNNGNDNMDASQFDYHSSQSECTKVDENGNSGQWINDGATHYTADGYVDNDGRPDDYVTDVSVNSGPSTNPIQTGVSDLVSVLTTVGGAAADLSIGLSNQLATLTGGKQIPYFRLFGSHYCGPGGGGNTNGGLDPACKAHDDCYAAAGLSAASNGSGVSLTLDQAAAAQGCNQALYDAARGHPNQLNGSAPLRQWLTKGDQVPFGHLAPGTEAKPW